MGTAIINHQAVAFMLADMAVGIELGRLMVRRAAWEYTPPTPTPTLFHSPDAGCFRYDQGRSNTYFASIAKVCFLNPFYLT